MNTSDSRFNARDHYSEKLEREIRALVEHPDGLDPEDFLIFSVEYLMNCFVLLEERGMLVVRTDVQTARKWRSEFRKRFQPWQTRAVYKDLLETFDKFVSVCERQ